MKLTGKGIYQLLQGQTNTLFFNWEAFPVEHQNNSIPVSIIVVPPQINLDRLDCSLDKSWLTNFRAVLDQKLNHFLELYYSKATLFLGSDWGAEGFQGQDSIARLFDCLKGNPGLILESQIDGNSINLRLGYWGLNDEEYIYNNILDNYQCSELAELDYLTNFLLNAHCFIASWIVDYYHLDNYGKSPLLPKLLPQLIRKIDSEKDRNTLIENLVSGYDLVYKTLAEKRPKLIPQLYLELAQSLIDLDKISLAKKIVKSSFKTWVQLNRGNNSSGENILAGTSDGLSISDRKYIQQLNKIYQLLSESERAKITQQYLRQVKASQQLSFWRNAIFKMPIFQGKIC